MNRAACGCEKGLSRFDKENSFQNSFVTGGLLFSYESKMKNERKLIFGDVVTPEKVLPGRWLSVEGARIGRIRPDKPAVKNASIIDCRGRYICPGFVDVHVQGSDGYDVWQGDYRNVNGLSSALARYGTTSFLATTHFDEGIVKNIVDAKKAGVDGARIIGIHLETPFVNLKKRGAIEKEDVRKVSLKYLRKVFSVCGKDLKIMTIAPEIPGAIGVIRELRKKGIVASIGHTDADYCETLAAIKAGATQATHMFNAMRAFTHREPGAAGCLLTEDGVGLQVVADGIHLHAGALKLIYRAKKLDDIILFTDATAAAGAGKRRNLTVNKNTKVYIKKGAVVLKDGTIAGSALTMNTAVRNFIGLAGASIAEAVRCASLNPARSLGMDKEIGSLEAGKRADITIMDKNFKIIKTFIGGRIIYNKRGIVES